MRPIHIALVVSSISASVADYARRIGAKTAVVVADKYAM
jgi:hypothetical protein